MSTAPIAAGKRTGWARWRVALGYPLAAICLWLAHPTWTSVLLGSVVALVGLFIRGAAAGTLRKGQALATSGLYAHTRNPLYFGSAFLAASIGIASRSWVAGALVVTFFGVFYYQTMRREEAELRVRYSPDFDDYARRVPLFFPRMSGGSGTSEFSWVQYRRNREYQAAIGVAVLMAVFAAMVIWRR